MTQTGYRERLERLREAVVAMGDLVSERLADAITALFTDDRTLAGEVIAGDDAINDRYLDIEHECLDLLALYQPVAGDLRFVVAAFQIVTDLERMGDLATNLAGYTVGSTGTAPTLPDVDFERIAALALKLVEDSINAFVTDDATACFAVANRDDELDDRCAVVMERLVQTLINVRVDGDGRIGSQPGRNVSGDRPIEDVLTDVSRTFVIVRDLERVGDHAANVAARTLYALESSEELLA